MDVLSPKVANGLPQSGEWSIWADDNNVSFTSKSGVRIIAQAVTGHSGYTYVEYTVES
jgi:hypothetical protein